jgi:hypothetical protein
VWSAGSFKSLWRRWRWRVDGLQLESSIDKDPRRMSGRLGGDCRAKMPVMGGETLSSFCQVKKRNNKK